MSQNSISHPISCRTTTQLRYSSKFAIDSKDIENGCGTGGETAVEGERVEAEAEEFEAQRAGEISQVPWYLQVDTPQRQPQPLSERQKIPELPEAPPPILEPLLQQISVQLGMDDLSLLDLRNLDPPPALGANLLMIIGTARSEKHLHVSADRLCRWLRSTYKLRPDADGLLGRNELKLKLKRKAKRAKLLGSAADENGDDGVRTGWVCVDIGIVEGSDVVAAEPLPGKDFIGFGRRVDGVRIVVQLLTDEKRSEIELEKLWGGILRRGGQPDVEPTEEQLEASSFATATSHVVRIPTSNSITAVGQRRTLHTSSRYHAKLQESSLPRSTLAIHTAANPFETFDLDSIKQSASAEISLGNFNQAKSDLVRFSEYVPGLKEDGWRHVLLDLLRIHIENVPEAQAMEELSLEAEGSRPTPFMACFQSAISFCPTEYAVESEIWLHCFARNMEHPMYTLSRLDRFINKLQCYGLPISRASYMALIRSVLRPRNHMEANHLTSNHATSIILEILRVMQYQGLEILNESMLVELLELTEPWPGFKKRELTNKRVQTYDLEGQQPPIIQHRLHMLMMKLPLPPFSDNSRMKLLKLYARHNCWLEFWDVFRMAPRACQPQSSAMYEFMFTCVANTRSQKGCMTVLRHWVLDMERETPPVKLEGAVAEAVKACLRVADPNVEQDAHSSAEIDGEWLSLWRRCH
jgi:hypothetical protein